jgi:predicted MFS family arabinose efflux permease
MFQSHITRPLKWAIPLAVVAAVVAAFWYLRPLTVDIDGFSVNCQDIGVFNGGSANPCTNAWNGRLETVLIILAVGFVPLLVVVTRAFVLGADLLVSLRDDVRKLTERLDSERRD